MRQKKIWIPLIVLIGLTGGFLFWQHYHAPRKLYPPTLEPGEISQGGHFHEDGTFHAEPHETPAGRPVLPPLPAEKPQKFVKPVRDRQEVTLTHMVLASGAVPDRAELEAMSDKQLLELSAESREKALALFPEVEDATLEYAKTEGDLTRHAKTRAERDAIRAENAHLLQPLREARESTVWEWLIYQQTARRASKILEARFILKFSQVPPESGLSIPPESLTDAFWESFWSDF